MPPKTFPKTLCNGAFGPTGVCILAKAVDPKTGVFGYGTNGACWPGLVHVVFTRAMLDGFGCGGRFRSLS